MRLNEVLKLAETAQTFCDNIFAVYGCEDGIEGFTHDEIVNMTDYYLTKWHSGEFEGNADDEKTVVTLLKEYNGVEA